MNQFSIPQFYKKFCSGFATTFYQLKLLCTIPNELCSCTLLTHQNPTTILLPWIKSDCQQVLYQPCCVKYDCVPIFQPKYWQGLTGSGFWHQDGTGLENKFEYKGRMGRVVKKIEGQKSLILIIDKFSAASYCFVYIYMKFLKPAPQSFSIFRTEWVRNINKISGQVGKQDPVRTWSSAKNEKKPGLQPKMNKKLESFVSWSC